MPANKIMGTNYFLRKNICKCCQRFDELHIGKSSSGWSFSFRGYKKWYEDDDTEEIKSLSDWKKQFEIDGVKIFNEYGEETSVKEFLEMVAAKQSEGLNHTTYCRTHHPRHFREDCWVDAEGNSFDRLEFR